MENYLARFLLVSELDDPAYFAKVHQEIADLEKKRVLLFNTYGPLDWKVITILGELNMAYMEAGDYENELTTAREIYQGTLALQGAEDDLTTEAQLALAASYLDQGTYDEAEQIIRSIMDRYPLEEDQEAFDDEEDAPERYDYLFFLDAISLQADIYFREQQHEKEYPLRKYVYEAYDDSVGTAHDQTIIARSALAYCLLSMHRYSDALDHLIVIHSYLDTRDEFATEAEKLGLLFHIGRCYRKLGRLEDSEATLDWALRETADKFGQGAMLTRRMHALTKNLEHHRQ